MGADLYNGKITGNIAATFNASSGCSSNHAGPSVIERRDDKHIVATAKIRSGCDGGGKGALVQWDKGMIADHPTPKICEGGKTAYTLNSRDYKGVMIVVVQNTEENNEFFVSRIRNVQGVETSEFSKTEGLQGCD